MPKKSLVEKLFAFAFAKNFCHVKGYHEFFSYKKTLRYIHVNNTLYCGFTTKVAALV